MLVQMSPVRRPDLKVTAIGNCPYFMTFLGCQNKLYSFWKKEEKRKNLLIISVFFPSHTQFNILTTWFLLITIFSKVDLHL